jgi:ankyrin repeat protein
LHRASIKGYRDIAALLLTGGAAVNAKSHHGRTPLHWAALQGPRDVVELLLKSGADISMRDELGRTPFDWAVERKHREVSNLLRQRSRLEKEKANERQGDYNSSGQTTPGAGAQR